MHETQRKSAFLHVEAWAGIVDGLQVRAKLGTRISPCALRPGWTCYGWTSPGVSLVSLAGTAGSGCPSTEQDRKFHGSLPAKFDTLWAQHEALMGKRRLPFSVLTSAHTHHGRITVIWIWWKPVIKYTKYQTGQLVVRMQQPGDRRNRQSVHGGPARYK